MSGERTMSDETNAPEKTAETPAVADDVLAEAPPEKPAKQREHWLRRPETIRKMWITGISILIVITLMDFIVAKKVKFGIDGTFGFYSWYGLGTCAVMVIFAKLLGLFIKRSDTYYEPEEGSGRRPR